MRRTLPLMLLLALLPVWAGQGYALSLLTQMGAAALACLAFQWLWGQGGMLSFGQAIYSGAGAYLAVHLMRAAEAGWPVPMVLVPLLAGCGSGLLAWALGGISTRRPGAALAMITLGLGELVWSVAPVFPAVFGGEGGLSADRMAGVSLGFWQGNEPLHMYALVAVYLLLALWGMQHLERSPFGLYVRAAREQAGRLAHVGPDPHRVRWMAFTLAGALAGIAGALSAMVFEIVTPEVFNPVRSGEVLLFTVLAGSRHWQGALMGGALMVLAHTVLPHFTPASGLYLGLVFMLVVARAPQGLTGLFSSWLSGFQAKVWAWPTPRMCLHTAALCGALVFAGGLVEMAYQQQQLSTAGTQLRWMGLTLNITQGQDWGWMVLAALACALVWVRSRDVAQGEAS